MVLHLKVWESRSPPGLQNAVKSLQPILDLHAGWSSPVARQAHNLKVAGSNPAPATNKNSRPPRAAFLLEGVADFDLTGAPEGGQRPTQRGKKHQILLPQPNTPKAVHQGGLWRIWTVDTGKNLPGPHQGGQSPTQKGKKQPNPAPATKISSHGKSLRAFSIFASD